MFVTYLTCYRGNKLPPFYIGSTSEERIQKGYNGTVTSKRYKALWRQERADHPNLFKTIILHRYPSRDEALIKETLLHKLLDAPNNPMYINMAIASKGFGGTGKNHPHFGIPWSDNHRLKSILNNGMRGKSPPNKGIPMSEEQKQKLRKPFTEEHKQKLRHPKSVPSSKKGIPMSEEQKQKLRKPKSEKAKESYRLANKGEKNPFFGKHHTEEQKQKARETRLKTKESRLG